MTDTTQRQIDIETLYSKHQLLPVLRENFMEIAVNYPDEDDHEMIAEVLAQMYLHRQCAPEVLVGILHPKYGEPQEIADKLKLFGDFDYIDFNEDEDPKKSRFVLRYEVTTEIQRMLDQYQYPLPMIQKPEKVTKNNETGYITIEGSVILNGSPWFKNKDVCLDHLNRANSVALDFDTRVISSEEGKFIRPVRRNGEEFSDFSKRQRAATVFYDTSLGVMEGLQQVSEEVYLTHKFDRRGRCYASGYHISTQGDDYRKAVLQLASKEVIT